MILDKCYDKNGNEIPPDYKVKEFKPLQDFLTNLWSAKRAQFLEEQENKQRKSA